jgi:hypothetical protein
LRIDKLEAELDEIRKKLPGATILRSSHAKSRNAAQSKLKEMKIQRDQIKLKEGLVKRPEPSV